MKKKKEKLSYILIIVFTITKLGVDAAFYEKTNDKSFESIIYKESGVASPLACAQLCKFRDAESIVVFEGELCQCLKKSSQEDKNTKTMITDGFCMEQKKIPKNEELLEEINVALKKPSKQSSNKYSSSYLAADGNDGDFDTFSVTEYSRSTQTWEVDLEQTYSIQRMVLHTSEYAAITMKYYHHIVINTKRSGTNNESWKVCKDIGEIKSTKTEIVCDEPTNARYVQVELRSDGRSGTLYIGEFDVYSLVPKRRLR